MQPPPFPKIPGLEFQLIGGFSGKYAISSDKRVWIQNRNGTWRHMRSYLNPSHRPTVKLQYPDKVATTCVPVEKLYQQVFGGF